MKKEILLLLIVALMAACTNNQSENNNATADETVTELSISDLLADAGNYVGKTVKITGTVDHVCKHGGKKLFIFGDSADDRIKITTGKKMNSFEIELEGSDVVVHGVLQELRVDEDYLANMENDLEKGTEKHETGDGKGREEEKEGEQGESDEAAQKEQIDQLRGQLESCGEDHLSFYSVECFKLEEIK